MVNKLGLKSIINRTVHGFECFAACHMWHIDQATAQQCNLLISRIESFRLLSFCLYFALELISFLPPTVINSLCIILCYANAARCLWLQPKTCNCHSTAATMAPATALALPLSLPHSGCCCYFCLLSASLNTFQRLPLVACGGTLIYAKCCCSTVMQYLCISPPLTPPLPTTRNLAFFWLSTIRSSKLLAFKFKFSLHLGQVYWFCISFLLKNKTK